MIKRGLLHSITSPAGRLLTLLLAHTTHKGMSSLTNVDSFFRTFLNSFERIIHKNKKTKNLVLLLVNSKNGR